jgi:hypothetical protein
MAPLVNSVESAALAANGTLAAVWCLFLLLLIATPAAAAHITTHAVNTCAAVNCCFVTMANATILVVYGASFSCC